MARNVLGGRSLTAIGLASPWTLPGVVSTAQEFHILEGGVAGVLVLPDVAGYFLTSLNLRGMELISGVVPFSAFSSNNPMNPILGYAFNESTKILIAGYDANAGTPAILPAITALPEYSVGTWGISQKDALENDFNAFGAAGSQLAIGPAAEATIGAGATQRFEMVITRPFRLGYLYIPQVDGLAIDLIEVQGDKIQNGETLVDLWSPNSHSTPGFGHKVIPQTKVYVDVTNNSGLPIDNVAPCFLSYDASGVLATMRRRQGVAANAS